MNFVPASLIRLRAFNATTSAEMTSVKSTSTRPGALAQASSKSGT